MRSRIPVTITYATITDEEMQNELGIDIGTVPRLLKAKGFEAEGKILPKLKGFITQEYNRRCKQTEFMQITEQSTLWIKIQETTRKNFANWK